VGILPGEDFHLPNRACSQAHSFPRKRESSNDFVFPPLRKDSVWTPASAGVTWVLTFYEIIKFVFGKGGSMPYVNIKITKEGVTSEKKAQLIHGITKLLADVLGKNPQTTVVVIEEIDTDNWGIGGETVTVRRQRKQ
jgi:4-oxalocrotonate tautomerase